LHRDKSIAKTEQVAPAHLDALTLRSGAAKRPLTEGAVAVDGVDRIRPRGVRILAPDRSKSLAQLRTASPRRSVRARAGGAVEHGVLGHASQQAIGVVGVPRGGEFFEKLSGRESLHLSAADPFSAFFGILMRKTDVVSKPRVYTYAGRPAAGVQLARSWDKRAASSSRR